VYAVDLFGSCLAALGLGLWALPVLGATTTLGLLAFFNAALTAALPGGGRVGGAGGGGGGGGGVWARSTPLKQQASRNDNAIFFMAIPFELKAADSRRPTVMP